MLWMLLECQCKLFSVNPYLFNQNDQKSLFQPSFIIMGNCRLTSIRSIGNNKWTFISSRKTRDLSRDNKRFQIVRQRAHSLPAGWSFPMECTSPLISCPVEKHEHEKECHKIPVDTLYKYFCTIIYAKMWKRSIPGFELQTFGTKSFGYKETSARTTG